MQSKTIFLAVFNSLFYILLLAMSFGMKYNLFELFKNYKDVCFDLAAKPFVSKEPDCSGYAASNFDNCISIQDLNYNCSFTCPKEAFNNSVICINDQCVFSNSIVETDCVTQFAIKMTLGFTMCMGTIGLVAYVGYSTCMNISIYIVGSAVSWIWITFPFHLLIDDNLFYILTYAILGCTFIAVQSLREPHQRLATYVYVFLLVLNIVIHCLGALGLFIFDHHQTHWPSIKTFAVGSLGVLALLVAWIPIGLLINCYQNKKAERIKLLNEGQTVIRI